MGSRGVLAALDGRSRNLLSGGAGAVLVAAGLQNVGNLGFHVSVGHIVGPAEYGTVGAVLTLTVALGIPMAALQVAVTRSVAEAGAAADPRALLGRLGWFAIAAGLGVAAVSPVFGDFLRIDTTSTALLLAPFVAVEVMAAAARGVAVGRGRLYAAAWSIVATMLVRLTVGVFATWAAGLEGALIGTILAEATGWLIAHVAAVRGPRGDHRIVLSGSALVETSAVTAGIWFLGAIDVLLARHYLVGAAAGIYVAAGTAARGLLVIAQALLMISMPRFVDAFARRSADPTAPVRLFARTAALAVLITAAGASVLALFGGRVLELAFGPEYAGGGTLLALLAVGTIPTALASTYATYRLAGHSRRALVPWVGAIAELAAIIAWHGSAIEIATSALVGLALQVAVIAALVAFEARGAARTPPHEPAGPRRARGLRILVYNWRDLAHPSAGGAEVYVHEVTRRWVAAGHDVTVFVAAVQGRPDLDVVDGVRIVRRGGRISVYRQARRYWESCGPGAFDLVIDCINTKPFATPRFVDDAPVVALAHQVAREVWFHEAPLPVALVGRYGLERRWLRRYARVPVLTVSESSLRSLEEFGLQNVQIVPTGVQIPSLVPWPEKRDAPTLVFCGRLVSSKRPSDALAAFAIVRGHLPEARLIVLGGGPLEARLRAGAPEGVEFRGRVGEQEKFHTMAEAHVLIATSAREGWGLVVSEAAAVGTPTVAYDVPGLRDSVRAGHGVLTAPDPVSMATRLVETLPRWTASPPRPLPYGGAESWDTVARRVLEAATAATGIALPAEDLLGVTLQDDGPASTPPTPSTPSVATTSRTASIP